MIQRISRRLDRKMGERLNRLDLTLQQFTIMMTVLETDGQTQTEIGNKFDAPPYAISRALDQLEAAGYLERRVHPSSRRTRTIHATPRGRKLGPQLFSIVGEVNKELVAPFTDKERAMFEKLLIKLVSDM
ncbi:MAG: MarR family transcriptional regulator [Marinosulfonomonas sp.]|nr:MarR family transcriptional regulator [Marinosulfonomonas sp.]